MLVTSHGKPRQTALERQNLSRMDLAHHELESESIIIGIISIIIIIIIIITLTMGNQDKCDGAGDSCLG